MVGYEDIEAAAVRLDGVARVTPVVTSRILDARVGGAVFLKCESFQRAGAFKFRGAYNALSLLDRDERRRGVVTHSSGNHAQAVALASRLLGVNATIVMPEDAPGVKRRATEGYGARVVTYSPRSDTREAVSRRIEVAEGLVLIPPFDHEHIVAGQGTSARELLTEVGELDLLLVPCGGGGLLSGSAIAAKRLSPACRVVGVEPELADDATRSFHSGVLHTVSNPPTVADGARTPSLGELTFRLVRQYVDDMLTVSESDILHTMRFAWERLKLVIEPTGTLGLAPLYRRHLDARGKRIGVILSGGNVDLVAALELLRELPNE